MRKTVILLGALAALWGCSGSEKPGNTRVSGVIGAAADQMITLSTGSGIDSTKITKEGRFSFNLKLENEETAILLLNNQFASLYLQPGKELTVKSSLSGFPDQVEFGGSLAPVNKYLRLSSKLDQQTAITQEELYVMPPQAFIRLTDSIREVKLQLLKEYVMRYPAIDSAFVSRNKADIHYAWATQRLLYPGYHALLAKKIPDLPDAYHTNYLQETELNNPALMTSSAYLSFLENYLDYRQALYLENHPEVNRLWFPESVARFRVIPIEFTDSVIRDYLLFTSMNDHLDNFGTARLETFLTNFELTCKNPAYHQQIHDKIDLLSTVERGQPAPDFSALTSDDQRVRLSDYQGKLLYINLWATWSPWSLQEFPYWEALIRQFDGRNVEFISVSLDFAKDIKNWKYIIRERQLNGIHLIQDPKSSDLQENYFISDLPRYLLIGSDGQIISVHAPRPGENMEEVLNRLLEEEKQAASGPVR